MAREVEAKFQVESEDLFDAIRKTGAVAGYAMTAGETVPQRDTYFDTPDALLFRAGWSLRLREKAGSLLVTFKGPFLDEHTRTEIEETITKEQAKALRDGRLIDCSCPAMVAARERIGDAVIAPALTVENEREAWYLGATSDGVASRIKLCFNRVVYTAGPVDDGDAGAGATLGFELEAELLEGDAAVLTRVARELATAYSLSPERRSKYQRGVDLLGVFA